MGGTAVSESHILTAPGEEDTAAHAGPHGATRGRAGHERPGGWRGRQAVQYPEGAVPLVPLGGRDGLVSAIPQLAGN